MRAPLIIILLIGGIGLWFWLLLGTRTGDENTVDSTSVQYTTKEESASVEATADTEAAATIPEDAPPQTDVGMEFPTLEE